MEHADAQPTILASPDPAIRWHLTSRRWQGLWLLFPILFAVSHSQLPLYSSNQNTYLIKYDAAGNVLWRRSELNGSDVATDRWGNIFMTGQFYNPIDFGGTTIQSAGGGDVFVVKYSADGSPLAALSAGGPGEDGGFAIATDRNGSVIVTGSFEGTGNFGSGTLTSANGSRDVFVFKMD